MHRTGEITKFETMNFTISSAITLPCLAWLVAVAHAPLKDLTLMPMFTYFELAARNHITDHPVTTSVIGLTSLLKLF